MSAVASYTVLLAEDDEADVLLMRRAFKQAAILNPLHVAEDGQRAIEYLSSLQLDGHSRLPALVLLDVKMPRRDGLQVLKWIRSQPIFRSLHVIMFSSSANRNDIEHAYEAGANGYLIKPPSLAERAEIAMFIKQWLRLVQAPIAAAESFQAAQQQRTL